MAFFLSYCKHFFQRVHINAEDKNKMTVLMHFAKNGNFELVKYLTEHGANIYETDMEERNAFLYSAYSKSIYIIKYFLNMGFNINEVTYSSETILLHAIKCDNIQ